MFERRSYFVLLLFVLIVAGVAMSGAQFQPGEWYAQLRKPVWTPPDWIFAPVWTMLYLMIAVVGWLIFSTSSRILKILWTAQLALNGLWSWLFFGMHLIGPGLVDILAMLACVVTLVVLSRKSLTAVSWLMGPYLAWVAYASALNIALYLLNPA